MSPLAFSATQPVGAAERIAKLHSIAGLVGALCADRASGLVSLPQAHEIDHSYEHGTTLVRARFDELAEQASALAAAGAEALLSKDVPSPAAIDRLATEIEREIVRLEAVLAGAR